jgi:hypothetical protein
MHKTTTKMTKKGKNRMDFKNITDMKHLSGAMLMKVKDKKN